MQILQVSFLNIKNGFPGIEALDNERIKILLKTKASKDGCEGCHSSATLGYPDKPEPFFSCDSCETEEE